MADSDNFSDDNEELSDEEQHPEEQEGSEEGQPQGSNQPRQQSSGVFPQTSNAEGNKQPTTQNQQQTQNQGTPQSSGPGQGGAKGKQAHPVKDLAKKGADKAGKALNRAAEAAKVVANTTGNPEIAEAINKIQKAAKLLKNIKNLDKAIKEEFEERKKEAKRYLILLLIIIGIIVAIIGMTITEAGDVATYQRGHGQYNPLVIQKTGPVKTPNSQDYAYTITVTYPNDAKDLTIKDELNDNIIFIDSPQWKKYTYDYSTNTVIWKLSDNVPNYNGTVVGPINESFTFTVRPIRPDTYAVDIASAQVIGASVSAMLTGDITKLLPNPPPQDPPGVQNTKNDVINKFKTLTSNISVYKQASQFIQFNYKHTIPWQVFAGLHYREGSADPNQSLVSGAPIGSNEPDVVAAGGCSNAALTGPVGKADGLPEPVTGGCGFSSLLDSAIYAGTVLMRKPGGNLTSFSDLVTALSHYNGGGDANCGRGVPYAGQCPPPYYGDDDTYPMDMFDSKHYPMFVIFCFRSQACNPAPQDPNPGVATIINWLAQSGIN